MQATASNDNKSGGTANGRKSMEGTNLDHRYLRVDGHRIAYLEQGDGQAIASQPGPVDSAHQPR